jgi:hypothetical protein
MPDDPDKRIELVRQIKIHAPSVTPFDSDAELRKIYIEEYILSYRAVMALVAVDCHMVVRGKSEAPMRAGLADGRKDAIRAPSKAAADALGLSFDEYKDILTAIFGKNNE